MIPPANQGTDTTGAFTIPHAEVSAVSTQCIRTYTATGAAPLRVTTTLLTHGRSPGKPRRYRVRIERTAPAPDNKPYSLVSIGVQAKRWHIALVEVTGQNVTFSRDVAPPPGFGPFTGTGVPVKKRVRRFCPRGGSPTDALIWFLNFEGEYCELLIASRRPHPDEVKKAIEHDVSPPPPEGGGEEEEEEEEDDEEGDDPGE